MKIDAPRSNIDLYSDEALTNPYPLYRELRDTGGAVWLNKLDMFVLSRYQDVRAALLNAEVFCSSHGVTMNPRMNALRKGNVLNSDGAEHAALRKILARPLSTTAMRALREQITQEAEELVERLVAKKQFDAATDLAQYLPVTIVSNLVGLPEEGRERMLDWAKAAFNCFGPLNDRTLEAFEIVKEMVSYAQTQCLPGKLKPGGWADMLWQAVERGELPADKPPLMVNDYMTPSLDTTIFATSSAVLLFAQNPEQWDLVRQNPKLIPNAINEAMRLESPLQGFSRYVTQDYEIDGVTLPAGSRAIVLYASANRDERKWENPEKFDVTRKASTHLAFGFGPHLCVGKHLALLEMRALFTALAKRVKRFELGESKRLLNNVLRGMGKLEVTVH